LLARVVIIRELHTYRNFALRSQCYGEDVQVPEDSGHCITPVAMQLLSSHGIVSDVIWVVKEGGLSNRNEILEESLT
jgi:hypothetical protein